MGVVLIYLFEFKNNFEIVYVEMIIKSKVYFSEWKYNTTQILSSIFVWSSFRVASFFIFTYHQHIYEDNRYCTLNFTQQTFIYNWPLYDCKQHRSSLRYYNIY